MSDLELAAPAASPSVWTTIRQSLAGSHHGTYTDGPIGRAILLLAVPMVLELVLESVFAVVDVFFVSRLGADAVATVGLTESMLTFVYAIAIGLSVGAMATVARRIGEGDADGAARAAVQAMALGLIVSAPLGVFGALYAPQLLSMMGATTAVLEHSSFAVVVFGANGVIMMLFLINAVFRGAGDAAVGCVCCGSQTPSTSASTRASSSASGRFLSWVSPARRSRPRPAAASAYSCSCTRWRDSAGG